MHLQETIICCTAPQGASSAEHGAIVIHDVETGSSLASFKHTNASANCTAVVGSRNAQGGFILSVQRDKAVLNVYNFQKDQLALRIVLPEKLTCIALDRRGDYCAGGTTHGRIHFWEVASGILYNSWDAHYQRVNVLRFTHDGSALLSGSEDSGMSVWSVSRLLDDDCQNEIPMPYCTMVDHTLPVTDIVCGVGSFPKSRVLTSSVDHTVKLWDLSSKSLLTTFEFPRPITCLAWDLAERFFFAASNDGSIHQMDMFRHSEDKLSAEAVGGTGTGNIFRAVEDTRPQRKRLISVGEPVTSLAISLTTTLLLAGTSTGVISMYDIPSHQLMRSISTHKGFVITHLATMLKPPDLIGHVSLNLSASASTADLRDVIPIKPVMAFQRIRDVKSREAHEVSMLLPIQNDETYSSDTYSAEELGRDHSFFVDPSPQSGDAGTLQTRVAELEAEVTLLRDQLGKAKGVNDMMWETVVQRVLVNGKSKPKQKERDEGGEMDVDGDGE